MSDLQVVFGATGALGAAIVRRLVADGRNVLAVVRSEEKAQQMLPEDTDFSVADATDADHVSYLCVDAAAVYNCVHVTGDAWLDLTDNLINGARQAGARLVFPSNIHTYGPLQQSPADENHPRQARSKRGMLRNAIEQKLLDARADGGLQVVIPRLAALYGPGVTESFLSQIFESALDGKTAFWYGKLNVPYDLLYVEDAAAACIRLAGAADSENPVWHVPGCAPITGQQFIEKVFRAIGARPNVGTRPRWVFQVMGALIPQARELVEVMYEFEQPTLMDGARFAAAFPDFHYTDYDTGVRETLDWRREHPVARSPAQAAAKDGTPTEK